MASKRNQELQQAKKAKKDEFYTQLSDIEKELKHYREYFKDKVILCNADDPYESNFFKYFALNFNTFGLKKLICTSYRKSPILGTQLSFGGVDSSEIASNEKAYKFEITEVPDVNGDGVINLYDIEELLKRGGNTITELKGDGDFRSRECIEILKEADIVVTNPPFSLFKEFISQLFTYNKDFLILGNMNAATYKEVFPYIIDDRLWYGVSIHSGDREFRVPDDYPLKASGFRVDEDGNKYIRVKGVRWFTNIDNKVRHNELILYKPYKPEDYPFYNNYDAINVNKVAEIPMDYDGVMGVPITFLDKYNPDQFVILGATESEGKGFSNGLWKEESRVTQPIVNDKRIYKRLFIKRK